MKKALLIMRLVIILLTAGILQVSAATFAQKVSLNTHKASLESVLKSIKQQTGYDIVADETLLEKAGTVDVKLKNVDLEEALRATFKDQQLTYEINDKTILVKAKQLSFFDKVKQALAAIDVSGRVVDENGQPLSGATVIVKGTGNATNTDANGLFVLKGVQLSSIISITFIGYDRKEIAVAESVGTIKLNTATSKLDEVKVVAYDQTSERKSVGDVTTISSKVIGKQPVNNPLLALQGRVSGLFITQATGTPGSTLSVQIQGKNSISSDSAPFFVVDGVPYAAAMLPNQGTSILGARTVASTPTGAGNPLSYLSPNDIESISVLKDADATSIYGSRAANGAIIITTKKGKSGETKVDFNIQNGWGQVGHMMKLLNTQQYLQMRHEAMKNDGVTVNPNSDYDLAVYDTTSYTDWQKKLIGRKAMFQDYNVAVSGGTAQTQYYVGSTYHREGTVYLGNYADIKGSLHFSINTQSLNQKFKVQLSGSYLHDRNYLPNTDLTQYAVRLPPDAPELYTSTGKLNYAYTSTGARSWTNPLYYSSGDYITKVDNLVSNGLLSYTVAPGLDVKTTLGFTSMRDDQYTSTPLKDYATDMLPGAQRSATFTYNNMNTWIVEPQMTYKRNFSKDAFQLLVGATWTQSNANGQQIFGSGQNNDLVLPDIKAAANLSVISSVASVYRYNAAFARINNDWDGKYLFEASVRRDGSSRFGSENQLHNFWSLGAGLVFTEYEWVKNHLPIISFGKIRASYGTTGNDQIGDYRFMNLYAVNNQGGIPYQGSTSIQANGLPNPYLQWEETQKLSLGGNIGLFKDRILLDFSYSRNRSNNQLLNLSLPYLTGFTSVPVNLPATIQNTSLQFQLNTVNIRSKEFTWETNFNFTVPRNKILKLEGSALALSNSFIVGQPIGSGYVPTFAGVNPNTGAYQFVNNAGQTTSDLPDYNKLQSLMPRFYGGFGNTFHYQNFELSLFFQFTNQKGLSNLFGNNTIPGRFSVGLGNEPVSVLNRWQKPGDQTNIARYTTIISDLGFAAQASDAAYTDASYLRLKNASLAYTLPNNIIHKLRMKSARVFVNAQNILTFTKYNGLDPESLSIFYLPPLRTISFGVQASF